jgi:hypothetical protein
MKRVSILVSAILMLTSCGPSALLPVEMDSKKSLDGYKYFYMIPTGDKSGTTGAVYSNGYGAYGTTHQKSTNPADVISGYLIKQGYIRVAELPSLFPEETFIVNYGESGRRSLGAWRGYTLEVTIQFISVSTNEVLCTVSGEGLGSTEADDIRIAINRCLQEVFGSTMK